MAWKVAYSKPSRPFSGMAQPLPAGGDAEEVVRTPSRELGAAPPQALQEVEERRITCPEIVRRAELGHHPPRLVAQVAPNRRRTAGSWTSRESPAYSACTLGRPFSAQNIVRKPALFELFTELQRYLNQRPDEPGAWIATEVERYLVVGNGHGGHVPSMTDLRLFWRLPSTAALPKSAVAQMCY